MALDHVNIRTADVPGTTAFFADILGMTVKPAPNNPDLSMAAWICDEAGRPVVHLGSAELPYPGEGGAALAPRGGGRVHHVALKCEGYDALTQKLKDRGQVFQANVVAEIGLRQLFIAEPNGVLIELNFFGD